MQFVELGLSERMALSLTKLELVTPTEIQTKVIPEVLAGRDIMASAQTGSGKTATYALPIIHERSKGKGSKDRRPKFLVLVPTRELALQVQSQFERFSFGSGLRTVCIYGGTGYDKQIRALERGVDVIVATPGRLFDHLKRGTANLSAIEMLILDEADRMLDMGFMPQVRQIVAKVPQKRQTLMFSATISSGIENAASEFLDNPKTVRVNNKRLEPSSIEQKVYFVDESKKETLLMELIKDKPELSSILIFARTRSKATKIKKRLCEASVKAEEIHGRISQSQRERTLARYRDGKFTVLVATDIAARGLDIPAISHVVNYDLPDSPEDYVHRIGRTGRAGRSGTAVSFVSSDQRRLVRGIENVTGHRLSPDSNGESDTRSQPNRNKHRRSTKFRGPGGNPGQSATARSRKPGNRGQERKSFAGAGV